MDYANLKLDDSTCTFRPPVYKWEIVIGDEQGIICRFETSPPSWLQKRMYKLLLGWEIRILEVNDD